MIKREYEVKVEKKQFENTQPNLFKKHNFNLFINNKFYALSYDAKYDGDRISIKVRNASNGEVVMYLNPEVDYVCKIYFEDRNLPLGQFNSQVLFYEDFCEVLFDYIVEELTNDKDFGVK